MNDRVVRFALRGTAIAIALAAVVDPSITSSRRNRETVAVIATDSARDATLADHVAKTVAKRYTVVRQASPIADASVIVGDQLPAIDELPMPSLVVLPDGVRPRITVERIDVPNSAPVNARVPVTAVVHVSAARNRTVDVSLRAGASTADHVSRTITTDTATLTVSLGFVPTATGATPLRVEASMSGAASSVADAGVDVRDKKWAVLFFDTRPSWTSTFVRRALERDPRFVITSRVVTSKNLSTDAGAPPGHLDDLSALALFDAVVIGAPEGLNANDVDGLEAFMRRRGGSVILLLDQRTAGAYDRLTDAAAWSTNVAQAPAPLPVSTGDSATLRATELAWPTVLPAGATVVAGGAKPIVWTSPVGAGRLIVNGALDAWRFRDPSASGFDRFWTSLIASSADAAPGPLTVSIDRDVTGPGGTLSATATLRGIALQPMIANASNGPIARATLSATVDGTTAVRLWPTGEPGRFAGAFPAPRAAGPHRFTVVADGATAEVPFAVVRYSRIAAPVASDLLPMWAATHGGSVVREASLDELPGTLDTAIRPSPRLDTWHPMRSPWWILPFSLFLAAEWFLRRRRGLR